MFLEVAGFCPHRRILQEYAGTGSVHGVIQGLLMRNTMLKGIAGRDAIALRSGLIHLTGAAGGRTVVRN
jgi:hypothetical protein